MKPAQAQADSPEQDEKPSTRSGEDDLPAGDSPPRPMWPLVVGVSVWVLWLGFLVVMMVLRLRTAAV